MLGELDGAICDSSVSPQLPKASRRTWIGGRADAACRAIVRLTNHI